jgi:3-phosphoshikimate 1-carboxyvinyltransferase
MERIAEPLRRMGARVLTHRGRPPLEIEGGPLRGADHELTLPSAQVKSAVLLAGLAAEGRTSVLESAPTRDHTERALKHLGAPISVVDGRIVVERFQHGGFAASVPGDISSAAFLIAAAALTGQELTIDGVGLNPTRTHFLTVMERMGIEVVRTVTGHELGEPLGEVHVAPCEGLQGATVEAAELPLVIDEVPVLAALAVHAAGDTRFVEAGELRVKESDRLEGLAGEIGSLGGRAIVEGDDLVVAGGDLEGGRADARGDHRMAMALVVTALGARSPVEVEGVEAAEISFPGFIETMLSLGARIES